MRGRAAGQHCWELGFFLSFEVLQRDHSLVPETSWNRSARPSEQHSRTFSVQNEAPSGLVKKCGCEGGKKKKKTTNKNVKASRSWIQRYHIINKAYKIDNNIYLMYSKCWLIKVSELFFIRHFSTADVWDDFFPEKTKKQKNKKSFEVIFEK